MGGRSALPHPRDRPDLTSSSHVGDGGGTTFHFLDAGPGEALRRARELAGGLDVRIGGGATTIREFLRADLIDVAHIVVVPIILGRGVRLWDSLEGLEERFDIEEVTSPSGVIHLVLSRVQR